MNKSDKEAFFYKMDILFYCCLIETYIKEKNFSNIGLEKAKDYLNKAINILELELEL